MDAIFAILVLGAVIFFGALISAGNERQRKAIDGIREQAAQWAIQDLRLKREHLARDVKVDDPVAWLNRAVEKVYGNNLNMTLIKIFDDPQSILCATKDGKQVIISPVLLNNRLGARKGYKKSLPQNDFANPLRMITSKTEKYELSILNAGVLFDLEMQLAWKALTGNNAGVTGRLWFYLI